MGNKVSAVNEMTLLILRSATSRFRKWRNFRESDRFSAVTLQLAFTGGVRVPAGDGRQGANF
jgi:hypothetical protein